jgi:formamidopyrimidine-DNA glycosylase
MKNCVQAKSRRAVKVVIMDQRLLAGIGNCGGCQVLRTIK